MEEPFGILALEVRGAAVCLRVRHACLLFGGLQKVLIELGVGLPSGSWQHCFDLSSHSWQQ